MIEIVGAAGTFAGKAAAASSLEDELTALEGEDKAEFLRFLRRMLKWDPSERASAAELLEDPWLAETAERERAAETN